MKPSIRRVLLACLVLVPAIASAIPAGWLKRPSKPPTIATFTAASPVLNGVASTLTISATGAASCSIDQGVGAVSCSGTASVSPSATTTYTLTATSAKGKTSTATASVTVNGLFREDANTVCHMYFNGSALQATAGCGTINMVGTVPQNAASGATPASAGPFSGSNYYVTAAVNDVFDLTSGFTILVAYVEAGAAAQRFVHATDAGGTTGFSIYDLGTGTTVSAQWPAAGPNTVNSSSAGVNVIAWGRTAAALTTGNLQLNLGAVASQAITNAQATTTATRLGVYGTGIQPLNGKLVEVMITLSDWNATNVTAWMNAVKALGITAW